MQQSSPESGEETIARGRPDLLAGQHFPPLPKQERSRRKRDALLESALVLFAEHGYEETSIEEIAHRAGVAVGGFYQHFASKRQILLVLMDRFLQEAAMLTSQAGNVNLSDVHAMIAFVVRQGLLVDWSYAGAYRAWREASVQDHELRILHSQVEQWTAQQLEFMFQALLQAPGARHEVDIVSLAWVLSQLFLRLAEAPVEDSQEIDSIVRTLTYLIYHVLFTDNQVTE